MLAATDSLRYAGTDTQPLGKSSYLNAGGSPPQLHTQHSVPPANNTGGINLSQYEAHCDLGSWRETTSFYHIFVTDSQWGLLIALTCKKTINVITGTTGVIPNQSRNNRLSACDQSSSGL